MNQASRNPENQPHQSELDIAEYDIHSGLDYKVVSAIGSIAQNEFFEPQTTPSQDSKIKKSRARASTARPTDSLVSVDENSITTRYLHEIGKYPLLTKEDEFDLWIVMEAGRKAQEQLECETLQECEQEELLKKVTQAEQAKNKFINSNLRLVVSIAKIYGSNPTFSMLDCIQEGNIGLMRAVDKFDASKGFKFSTYATWWIRQAIQRGKSNGAHSIRLPIHRDEDQIQIDKVSWKYYEEYQRFPSDYELAERTGKALTIIKETRSFPKAGVSLNSLVKDGEQTEFGQLIALQDQVGNPEARLDDIAEAEVVRELVSGLAELPRQVVTLHYGLNGSEPLSIEKVADRLNVSPETARLNYKRALKHLREKYILHVQTLD